MVKNLLAMQETWVQSLGQDAPVEKKWLPTPVFLPGEFHGQRRLVGYSAWSRRAGHDWATSTFTFHFHGTYFLVEETDSKHINNYRAWQVLLSICSVFLQLTSPVNLSKLLTSLNLYKAQIKVNLTHKAVLRTKCTNCPAHRKTDLRVS